MEQKTKIRRRIKSQVEQYQKKRVILPFIKPKYMNQFMFTPTYTEPQTARKSGSTINLISELNQLKKDVRKIKTQLIEQQNSMEFKERKIYRYRPNNFQRHQLKLRSVCRNEKQSENQPQQLEQLDNQPQPMFYPLVKRKIKRRTNIKTQQITHQPSQQQPIFRSHYYYPLIIRPDFSLQTETIQIQQSPIKKGKIKKQNLTLPKPRMAKEQFQVLKRKYKRCFNAILFVVFMRSYCKRYRQSRKLFLQKLGPQGVKQKLFLLKKYFIDYNKTFFDAVIQKYKVIYQIHSTDSHPIKEKKIESLRKLVKLQFHCIIQALNDMKNRNFMTEIVYSLCKHGNYGTKWKLHTEEQLNISCISQQYGYIRSDSSMQKANIISLVLVKILVYNVLLQPETIQLQINPLLQKSNIYFNLKLIANIIYEILIEIQDKYLDKADPNFKIGNWRQLVHKFQILTAESMTIKQNIVQKTQLISGLTDHHLIKNVYRIQQMKQEQQMVQEMISIIYQNVRAHHLRYRKACF